MQVLSSNPPAGAFSDSRVDMDSITDALSWVDNLLDDVHRLADERPDRTRSTAPATDSSPRSGTTSPPPRAEQRLYSAPTPFNPLSLRSGHLDEVGGGAHRSFTCVQQNKINLVNMINLKNK